MQYSLRDAADCIGVSTDLLRMFGYAGIIPSTRTERGVVFEESALELYRTHRATEVPSILRDPTRFDVKYGAGSYQRLVCDLANPCMKYSDIGRKFHITGNAVGEWHNEISPLRRLSGHARRDLCVARQARQEMFEDPLVRMAYRSLRPVFSYDDITFVPRLGRHGFVQKMIRVRGHAIALHEATPLPRSPTSRGDRYRFVRPADRMISFTFFRVSDHVYYFLPNNILPKSTNFIETKYSKYWKYRNNFQALVGESLHVLSAGR